MRLLKLLKYRVLGPAGERPRQVRTGLLKGLTFNIDSARKSMRLVGLDEREIESATRAVTAGAGTDVIALDIGANDGWYAMFFASRPNVRAVYAFEPGEDGCRMALGNFDLNPPAMRAKLTMTRKLVGDKDDEQWCSVDAFLPQLTGPVVMKIDVDGGEMDVLRGADRTLRERCRAVVLETHAPDLERDCKRYLEERGFRTRIITKGWYRAIVPEARSIPHNQWLIAERAG